MKISHVIRGEDHLSNTPKHILLLRAMGFEPPQYGHLSLIHGEGGEPLSKRLESVSVRQFRKRGYLPFALAARLARPTERVVLLTGDGSFGFSAMEIDSGSLICACPTNSANVRGRRAVSIGSSVSSACGFTRRASCSSLVSSIMLVLYGFRPVSATRHLCYTMVRR